MNQAKSIKAWNVGLAGHMNQRVPLDQQKSQASQYLVKLTDETISSIDNTERQKLELITPYFLELLQAQQAVR